jgi:hypothetical protein
VAKWFQTRKEDLPESIRELSPEDLDKALKDKAALESRAAQLDTEINTLKTSTVQKTEYDEVKQKLADLEARIAGSDPDPKPDPKPTGPASVFVNEEQAFRDRTAGLAGIAYQSGALAARMTAREAVQNSKDGRLEMKIWDKYANEINTLMTRDSPDNQINPQRWMSAFIYVKGMHFNDLQAAKDKKEDVFAETGSSTGDFTPDNKTDKDKLSPEELKIAEKFKMTPEKYLERKKNMKFVGA